jgi:hypothetical protein
LNIQVKLCFTYNDTPVTIELNADSLSALDELKWLVDRVTSWIHEEKQAEEFSGQ